MGSLKKIIRQIFGSQNSLERKLFWSILLVVTLVAASSAVFTIYEGLNVTASLCSVGCATMCIGIALVAVKTSLYDQCYLVMCCMLNCFMLPLLFLFCGGITSGMPLYFITGTSLLAFAKRGVGKWIGFFFSVLVQTSFFIASWLNPEIIFETLDRNGSYLDMTVTLVLTSITLFAVGTLAMHSYDKERKSKEELLKKLDFYSMRDPLTNVYNRRYLLGFMEREAWRRRESFYLLVLGVDHLNDLCRSYGYAFGDQVLSSVAKVMTSKIRFANECVARYGSGAFAYVMESPSEGEALAAADQIRRDVENFRIEGYPMVRLTVSGGFVSCRNRNLLDYKQALDKASEFSQLAESLGMNQIQCMMEK